MLVYIGGEDTVTRCIAKKLVVEACPPSCKDSLVFEDAFVRSSGSKSLNKLQSMVELGKTSLVVGVYDSDGDCVVRLLEQYLPNKCESSVSAINFAIDEAESWLLADRKGFADYFGVPAFAVPIDISNIPYKTSMYILNEIIPHSRKKAIRDSLSVQRPFCKPATYNNEWPNYIMNYWDVSIASQNSISLKRAIGRISRLFQNV